MHKWDLIISDGQEKAQALLEEGWEPFAAGDGLIYFRRPHGLDSKMLQDDWLTSWQRGE